MRTGRGEAPCAWRARPSSEPPRQSCTSSSPTGRISGSAASPIAPATKLTTAGVTSVIRSPVVCSETCERRSTSGDGLEITYGTRTTGDPRTTNSTSPGPTCPSKSSSRKRTRTSRACPGARSTCTRSGVTSTPSGVSALRILTGTRLVLRFRTRMVSSTLVGLLADNGEREHRRLDRDLLLHCAMEVEQPGDRRVAVAHGLRRAYEQPTQLACAGERPTLGEHRGGARGDGGGDARAADRPVAHLALLGPSGLRRRDGDPRRDQLGLRRPAEGEAARRERGDGPAAGVLGDVDGADRHGHGDPRRLQLADRARELRRKADDGDAGRHGEAERAGGQRTVHEDRASACGGCLVHGLVGQAAARDERGATGDRARAPLVEERHRCHGR